MMMMKQHTVVLAVGFGGAIGSNGKLPWGRTLKQDLVRFKRLTAGGTLLMGRKTWESIGCKPLPDRNHVIISRDAKNVRGSPTAVASSLDDALARAYDMNRPVFVVGGANIVQEAWTREDCTVVELTRVYRRYSDANTRVDLTLLNRRFQLHGESTLCESDDRVAFQFETYRRISGEQRYLDLVKRVMDRGVVRTDRTGVGTKALFGQTLRFDLSERRMPLFTTKRVFWRGIVEELFWFLRGSTDVNELTAKGIHFWDANASRSFLDNRGLTTNRTGDIGPAYGFQWRHFGAKYRGCAAAHDGSGVDQIKNIERLLRDNPSSRRILLTAWNPSDLSKTALPPCHVLAQFCVDDDKNLTCCLYQRSADLGLGVPFNVASYALLTHLFAHCAGLRAKELVHTMGDTHLYLNHEKPMMQCLERTPLPAPRIMIDAPEVRCIDDLKPEHVTLEGYRCHASVPMKMAV